MCRSSYRSVNCAFYFSSGESYISTLHLQPFADLIDDTCDFRPMNERYAPDSAVFEFARGRQRCGRGWRGRNLIQLPLQFSDLG